MDKTAALDSRSKFLMNQIIVAIIAALIIMLGWSGHVLAADTNTAVDNPTVAITAELDNEGKAMSAEAKIKGKYTVKSLDEYKLLLAERAKSHVLKKEIAKNQKAVVQATVYAKHENKDIAAIVKAYRENNKKLQNQAKVLWKAQKTYWQDMRTARHARNLVKMNKVMHDLVLGRRAINANLEAVRDAQLKFIKDLKNAPQKTVKAPTKDKEKPQVKAKTPPPKGKKPAMGPDKKGK